MPVQMRFTGSGIVHEIVPWPAECKLQPRREEDMTQEELRAELKLLMTDKEDDLHRACCINPSCPARR